MTYTPHTWQNGETITATNLNRIEEGLEELNNGYNKLYNTLNSLGYTPYSHSPSDIDTAIRKMYDGRFNETRAVEFELNVNNQFDFGRENDCLYDLWASNTVGTSFRDAPYIKLDTTGKVTGAQSSGGGVITLYVSGKTMTKITRSL